MYITTKSWANVESPPEIFVEKKTSQTKEDDPTHLHWIEEKMSLHSITTKHITVPFKSRSRWVLTMFDVVLSDNIFRPAVTIYQIKTTFVLNIISWIFEKSLLLKRNTPLPLRIAGKIA